MKKIIKIILFLTLTLLMSLTSIKANEKIKIGLLIPLTGKNSEIGESIINSVGLAINKINNSSIEIIPKDTGSNPDMAISGFDPVSFGIISIEELLILLIASPTELIIDSPISEFLPVKGMSKPIFIFSFALMLVKLIKSVKVKNNIILIIFFILMLLL